MKSLEIARQLLRELTSRRRSRRVPEPELITEDPEHVEAFHTAGAAGGAASATNLFHAAQESEVILPGETVLDLGCGPANQLALLARLNPETRFVGLDLSVAMLARADRNLAEQGIGNVRLQRGDITDLSRFEDRSVDAVLSTMTLHHLPDVEALRRCFAEIDRVLKPGGGLYLADFGHLKAEETIRHLAHRNAERQPAAYTADYENSLRAAFELADWREGHRRHLAERGRLCRTVLAPLMVAVKSARRREIPDELRQRLGELRHELPPRHRSDLESLRLFFRLGGLATRALEVV